MKKLLSALLIIFLGSAINFSCTKMDLNTPSASQGITSTKTITPYVLDCGTGSHWDYYLKKCVPDCPSGYHNDSITGACVADGGGGTNSTITVVTNPNNPVENVGSDHNSGMTNIIPNYDYGQLQPTEENVLAYVKNWQYSTGVDTTNFTADINWEEEHFGEQTVLPQHDFDNGITVAYSQAFISLTEKNYLTDLSNEIKSFTADSVDIPTQSQYNTYANTLISYENQIGNDGNLDSTARFELYAIFAVARYSAVYAINYGINNSGGIIAYRSMQTMSLWPSWLHLGRIVSADCWGALGGVVTGAIASLPTGGTAAVPLMVANGTRVAVVSSIGALGSQIYNHYNPN